MRNLNEIEATRLIAELARNRAAAGKPRLTEWQAATILAARRKVADLPEVTPAETTVRIPEPRPSLRGAVTSAES